MWVLNVVDSAKHMCVCVCGGGGCCAVTSILCLSASVSK